VGAIAQIAEHPLFAARGVEALASPLDLLSGHLIDAGVFGQPHEVVHVVALAPAVEEAALLAAMHRIVGGVEVQHQLGGRLVEGRDELIDQHLMHRDGNLAVGPVLQPARFSNQHIVGLLAAGLSRSTAVCHAKSQRRVS